MPHDDPLHEKVATYLQAAYSMENQIVEALESQIKATQQQPAIQARIQEHLEATRQHRARVEQCLHVYGAKPSAIKGMLSSMMGNMQGALGGTRTDMLALTARDDFVVENFEIGSYALLIAMAQLCGDQDTVRACELNLRDELVMREWLQQHIVEACFLSLQQDGINVPRDAWQTAQVTVQSALQAGSMPGWQASAPDTQSMVGGPA